MTSSLYKEYSSEHSLAAATAALSTDRENALEEALKKFIECSASSHIIIFKNFIDTEKKLAMKKICEQSAEESSQKTNKEEACEFQYEKAGLQRWQEFLSQNKILYGIASNFPKSERDFLQSQGIKSILVIPIIIEEKWFGFIRFDVYSAEYVWNEKDILKLKTFTQILSSYFQRNESKNQLLRKKEQFELALKGSNDGIWDWDLVSNKLFLSKRWKEMLGYSPDELEDSFSTFSSLLHEEDRKRVIDYVQEYLNGNFDIYDIQFRMLHKNGSYRWIRARGEALYNEEGKPYRMAGSHTDITEQKEAEFKMQTANRIINESSAVAFVWRNGKGWPVEYVSENVGKHLGYTAGEFLNKNIAYSDIIHPEDRLRVQQEVQNASKQKTLDHFIHEPYRIITAQGEIKWLDDRTTIIRNDKGIITHYQGIVIDITQKKWSEIKLKEREEQFKTIFHNSPQPMALTEVESGELIEVNDIFCQKVGASKSELLGKKTTELGLYTKEERKDFSDELKKTGKVQGMVMKFRTLKSMNLLARMYATFITVNSKKYILTVFDDITEQKKAEDALRLSEEKFRNLVENANDIVYSLSLDGFFTYVSPNWLHILGHDSSEVIGRTIEDFVHPDDISVCRAFLAKVIETGEKQSGVEYRVRHKNGTWRWHTSNASPLINDQGQVISYIGVAHDITVRKKAETDLLTAKQQAEAANKAKSEFLANMSHEIRTPLNGVIGFTELLSSTKLSNIQKQYLENAHTSAHTLLGVINDILDFSKIEAGKLELEIVKSDIIELIEQSVDIIKLPAANKNLEVLLNYNPRIPRFAFIDPIRLKQVLANLLGNAVKFTEKGEIELKVNFTEKKNGRGLYTFIVRDTGIGIPKQRQSRLFKAFSQADSSTTRQFGGTGLGLIISDMIVKKMGGKIQLNSSPESGSTFNFSIESDVEQGKGLEQKNIKNIRRCLVIDDNENNREILEQVLKRWNIACTGCENGFESLQLIDRNNPFDVVIVDYHMPYIDGIETITMIRERLDLSPESLPIILLHSSSDDEKVLRKCDGLGVCHNIIKPVKPKELYEALANLRRKEKISYAQNRQKAHIGEAQVDLNDLKKYRVLLVEDNSTNRFLAKTLIQQIVPNAELFEARTGREAIDLYEETDFDIIFMDVQMPEMDGNNATALIRNTEKGTEKHVPIIGLTAGALKSERDKGLKAGMDNYLTKPVNAEKLRTILNEYLYSSQAEEKTCSSGKALHEERGHFDKYALLQIFDDEKLLSGLLEEAKRDIPEKLISLEKAISSNNHEEISKIAHQIKGIASNLRFTKLASLVNTVEEKSRANEVTGLENLYGELKNEWDLLLPLLNSFP